MAKKKTSDESGLVVEMLQQGGDTLRQIIAWLFTCCLQRPGQHPTKWKSSLISVLHKKGDAKSLDNYRPITLLPIMYKLFTRILHARLRLPLEAAQCADQA
eukprot:556699-Karenia_brevis.AAC.1